MNKADQTDQNSQVYDLIVIGSGIGGLTAAAMVARHKKKVLVLEANCLPGGCCSSYPRKGYIFESGATTLMGFDDLQPLNILQKALGFSLVKKEINPSMTVWLNEKKILRPKDFDEWLAESEKHFGKNIQIEKLWRLIHKLSNIVWKIAGTNLRFPPQSIKDLLYIALQNNVSDIIYLKYAFISTKQILKKFGLDQNRTLVRFLDEQLMVTAQSTTDDTPFLFAAPALSYTHSRNYYLPGGMISLPKAIYRELRIKGSELRLRKKVVSAKKTKSGIWEITDHKGNHYYSKNILSNIPVWNLTEITEGALQKWSEKEAERYKKYWGAFTMGIVCEDLFPEDLTIHHQIILDEGERIPWCGSKSIFISFSDRSDTIRCPDGQRVLSVATHAQKPGDWFNIPEEYETRKKEVIQSIIQTLESKLPGFRKDKIIYQTASTPLSWYNWTSRHQGTVGGIPQHMSHPVFGMSGAVSPEKSFFRCGDTVYPGQGIPGVTLGGIIAAERILRSMKK